MTDEATPLVRGVLRSRRGDMVIDLEQATIQFLPTPTEPDHVAYSDHEGGMLPIGTLTGRWSALIDPPLPTPPAIGGNPCAEIPLPPLNNHTIMGFDFSSIEDRVTAAMVVAAGSGIGLAEQRVMTQLDFYREMYRDFSRLFMPQTPPAFEGIPHVKQKPGKKVKATDELAMRAAQRKAAKRELLAQIASEAVPKKRAREGRWTPHVKRALDV